MKIDKTVWKETAYVALGTFLLSALMILIYSIVYSFELKALYGALFGSVAAILNFFFMAYTLQKAVEDNTLTSGDEEEEKEAKEKMKLKIKASYTVRSMVYIISLAGAIITGFFNVFTLLIPALFPTMIAKVRMIWLNKHGEE